MFMSTRYKKRDPDWKKRPLFAVEDSLAKLLNCLSIEYSVSKLISPKYKNFRSQKLKFESKTRINNAIWRAWHIQYKINKRPSFCQFAAPFSDQTVHSTPQAVILEGKKWKRRLDMVSRKYKKWRKFYNVKILKGESAAEESDTLNESSNENSEEEFLSEEEEDTEGSKLRLSPCKQKNGTDPKNGSQNQKFFQSPEFMIDTFMADLPDTLFSSIRPARSAENNFNFQCSDLSGMIQPTLDQLNPCFNELMNFDLFADDFHLTSSRTLETVEEHPSSSDMERMMNLSASSSGMQQGLLDERMYDDPLDAASAYLYSAYLSGQAVSSSKDTVANINVKSSLMPNGGNAAQPMETIGKREIAEESRDVAGQSPPRKILIKDVIDVNEFEASSNFAASRERTGLMANSNESGIIPADATGLKTYRTNFETILSNTISSCQATSSTTSYTGPFNDMQSKADVIVSASGISLEPSVKDDEKSTSDSSARKLFVSPNAAPNSRTLDFSELPPQLQAPNLTAHLQAVMSARPKVPPSKSGAIPRNKSDTHLASLASKAEKAGSHATTTVQNSSARREGSTAIPARLKRGSKLPRNMSDTSLIQLAKDSTATTTKVAPRQRRLSSMSLDTKTMILPKNFSDSNLCALAVGGTKRPPQPILPKNLVAIAPSTQVKPPIGILPKVVSNAARTAPEGSSASQFSTFVVNKQQPCSAEPVQVKLYMPKTKQTILSTMANTGATQSSLGLGTTALLPQRVEVIQYQGPTNQIGMIQRQDNGEVADPGITLQQQQQQKQQQHGSLAFQTHSQSSAVIQSNQQRVTNSARIAYVAPSSTSLSVRPQMNAVSNNSALAPVPNAEPVKLYDSGVTQFASQNIVASTDASLNGSTLTAASNAGLGGVRPINVAPLQGLSEQQLLTLAQVLQSSGGSGAGAGHENTIAYLEMLQQQLNTLLMQQQAMLKGQQNYRTSPQTNPEFVRVSSMQSQSPLPMSYQTQITTLPTVPTGLFSVAEQTSTASVQLSTQVSNQQYQSPGGATGTEARVTPDAGVAVVVVNDAGSETKTPGDGTTRPTMVDLAMAASQRSYLVSPSSIYSDTVSREAMAITTTPSSSTTTQPIPSAMFSDSSETFSDGTSGKRTRVRFENRDSYKEYRRRNHVSAEQKRRGLIKLAFDQMISLIPSLQADKQGRTSKALILQRGAAYIEQLQQEQEQTKYKMERLRTDVVRLNAEISVCQQKLPACGAVSSQDNVKNLHASFLQHLKERILQDHKYWIFSVMIRPLFQSFHEAVVIRTLQEFIQSVLKWFDEFCGLPRLRPVVISTLTQFSTNTGILSNPSSFPSQAVEAAARQDPTVFGQQQQQQADQATAATLSFSSNALLSQSPHHAVLQGQSTSLVLHPSNETLERK
eukprot:gene14232-15716_t